MEDTFNSPEASTNSTSSTTSLNKEDRYLRCSLAALPMEDIFNSPGASTSRLPTEDTFNLPTEDIFNSPEASTSLPTSMVALILPVVLTNHL